VVLVTVPVIVVVIVIFVVGIVWNVTPVPVAGSGDRRDGSEYQGLYDRFIRPSYSSSVFAADGRTRHPPRRRSL
jgi:hypothetical protein